MKLAPAFPFSRAPKLALFAVGLLLFGCASEIRSPAPAQAEASPAKSAQVPDQSGLFDRLGGMQALEIVVDETVDQAARDPRTSANLKDVNLDALKQRMVALFCHVSGGPCTVEAGTLQRAQQDLALNSSQFDAFAELLGDTLVKYTTISTKNEFMHIIISMRKDIIAR